jgi:hypothetical protein
MSDAVTKGCAEVEQPNGAAREMARVNLGDQRLNRRAASLLETLGAKPTVSIPAACKGWAETQAVDWFFAQERVTVQEILAPHSECTLERARRHPLVLAIQDTSELDYTGKSEIEGLGPLTYANQYGLHIHPTLMVTPERVPLGVFDAWNWARDPEDFGTDRGQRPIEEKESIRWLEGYQRVCEAQAELPETQLVYVADRESDIYELFQEAQKTDQPRAELLIRASQNRCLANGQKLWEAAAAAPVLGEITFTIPATQTRPAREVTQTLRAASVVLKAPRGKGKGTPAVRVTAVLAREETPPDGVEAIEWLLLTTCPVKTFEQACEVMSWYLARWSIELFFKILKSGCQVEELQLEHVERLEPALAMYLIVAWRVLLLTTLGRDCPDLPCDVVFETEEWQAAYTVAKKAPPPEEPPALGEMVRIVAGFGGFLNRKHDGFPGSKTLWIGLQRVQDFAIALAAQDASQRQRYV